MSKTSDIVEPVIDLLISDLRNISLEESSLEEPNTISVPPTMSQPEDPPTMDDEDIEIQQLLDEKNELQIQINEINKKKK